MADISIHFDDAFNSIHDETVDNLKRVLETSKTPIADCKAIIAAHNKVVKAIHAYISMLDEMA